MDEGVAEVVEDIDDDVDDHLSHKILLYYSLTIAWSYFMTCMHINAVLTFGWFRVVFAILKREISLELF